jgi:N utilization substance protein B
MNTRRKGRESALQILYQMEILSPLASVSRANASDAIEKFFEHFETPNDVLDHATSLVHGVLLNHTRIDELIAKHSEKWRIERMAIVDRNVLRIACYEFLFSPDLTPSIIIDEAVEIAKRFGSDKSASFVNGILDAIAAETRKNTKKAQKK